MYGCEARKITKPMQKKIKEVKMSFWKIAKKTSREVTEGAVQTKLLVNRIRKMTGCLH